MKSEKSHESVHHLWDLNNLSHNTTVVLVPKLTSGFKLLLPDVSLHTALSSELVLHQVCVVGGRDEIVAQREGHVLVDAPLLWVEDGALGRAQVHQKTIKGHDVQHFGWK